MARDKKPSATELQVLAMMTASEPRTGTDIAARFSEAAGERIPRGTLYVTIGRLIEAGWVRNVSGVLEDRRTRKFALTADGLDALRQARRAAEKLSTFGKEIR